MNIPVRIHRALDDQGAAVSRIVVALIAAVLAAVCAGGGPSSPGVAAATALLTAEQIVTELAQRIPTVKPGSSSPLRRIRNRLLGPPTDTGPRPHSPTPAFQPRRSRRLARERLGGAARWKCSQTSRAQRRMQFIQETSRPGCLQLSSTTTPRVRCCCGYQGRSPQRRRRSTRGHSPRSADAWWVPCTPGRCTPARP